jgi:uncharacterized protein RhaS with RHS repeats
VHLEYWRSNWQYCVDLLNYDIFKRRFLSQDPTGHESGDDNYYRYAGNNPLLISDPLGLASHPISDGISPLTEDEETQMYINYYVRYARFQPDFDPSDHFGSIFQYAKRNRNSNIANRNAEHYLFTLSIVADKGLNGVVGQAFGVPAYSAYKALPKPASDAIATAALKAGFDIKLSGDEGSG